MQYLFSICGGNFTLQIVNIVAQGNYYTAEHDYSMTQSLYLSVCLRAAPSVPQNVQVVPSHSSLTLSWDPPEFPRGRVTDYMVS